MAVKSYDNSIKLNNNTFTLKNILRKLNFIPILILLNQAYAQNPNEAKLDSVITSSVDYNNSINKKALIKSSSEIGSVWTLSPQDKTIKKALNRWANEAGWQLIWRSTFDMPIQASLSINGKLEEAVNEICRASGVTGKQLFAVMYDKNKVLVVSTSSDQIK